MLVDRLSGRRVTGLCRHAASDDSIAEAGQAGEPAGFNPVVSDRGQATDRKTLSQPAAFTPFDGTLKQLRDVLQEKLQVPVYLDKRALSNVGIDPATPMKFNTTDISGKSALTILLGELELAWTIKDEVLWITSLDQESGMMDTRVYSVTDLVRREDRSGGTTVDFAPMIDLLTLTVPDNGWDDGEIGSAQGITIGDRDLLIVSQTHSIHDRIAELIAKLRGCQLPPVADKATAPR